MKTKIVSSGGTFYIMVDNCILCAVQTEKGFQYYTGIGYCVKRGYNLTGQQFPYFGGDMTMLDATRWVYANRDDFDDCRVSCNPQYYVEVSL